MFLAEDNSFDVLVEEQPHLSKFPQCQKIYIKCEPENFPLFLNEIKSNAFIQLCTPSNQLALEYFYDFLVEHRLKKKDTLHAFKKIVEQENTLNFFPSHSIPDEDRRIKNIFLDQQCRKEDYDHEYLALALKNLVIDPISDTVIF